MDLAEGTIPLASFMNEPRQCDETEQLTSIPITSVDGDTIESLFALYPDSELDFMERLSTFYSLNPHLQNQQITGGEKIVLPISRNITDSCKGKVE